MYGKTVATIILGVVLGAAGAIFWQMRAEAERRAVTPPPTELVAMAADRLSLGETAGAFAAWADLPPEHPLALEPEALDDCRRGELGSAARDRLILAATGLVPSDAAFTAARILAACGEPERALGLILVGIESGQCPSIDPGSDPIWESVRGSGDFERLRELAASCGGAASGP